jgi:hypothetical protein
MPRPTHHTGRSRASLHESFLRHANGRWAKVAGLVSLVALLIYLLDDPTPHPQGDTLYGYTLGTIGVGLILWLTALGIRKRTTSRGRWSLKAWTSAHVWLGLSLVVIATLHTGFQFGWNVHTLAYALMMLVVLSGLFGVTVYALLPARVSENRAELTEGQMLEAIRALDRQLHAAAQPLSGFAADLVRRSLDENIFGIGLWRRLFASDRPGATAEAHRAMAAAAIGQPADAIARVRGLLMEKLGLVSRIHRHMHLRALLEIWLYLHVPATIALIAALLAHIVAVFFYW